MGYISDNGLFVTNGYSLLTVAGTLPAGISSYAGASASFVLPDATANNNPNATITFKNSSVNTLTVYGFTSSSVSQTIDGGASTTITTGNAKHFYSTGTNYLSI